MAWMNIWISAFLITFCIVKTRSQTVTLTPRSIATVVENATITFTCSITVQQNWRSTKFYDYKSTSGIILVYNTGASCTNTQYDSSSYDTTYNCSGGIFTMTIKSVLVAYDKTSIRCEAIYGTGNVATDVKVQDSVVISVQVAPKYGPSITQSPQGPINDGKAVLLTCEVIGGNPLANLSWQCQNSSVIQPTGSPPSNKTTSSIQLIVNRIFNGLTCICTAQHVLWDLPKTQSHKLEVYFAPSTGPVITQSPQGPINEGRTVVLTCEVTGGNPLANVSWQCNNSSVIQPTESPPTDKATSSVQLTANRLLNGKACTCAAQHVVWAVPESQRHTLVVHFAPEYGPIITQNPPGSIHDGDTVALTCEITGGNPLANLSWQCQDSSVIQTTETPPINKTSSSIELIVNRLFNGRTCVCTGNHLLWTLPHIQNHTLNVFFAPLIEPVITQTPEGPIYNGSIVVLSCEVTGGNPLANLSWQCNDSSVILPTRSPLNDTAISTIQLEVNHMLNGRICICIAKHPVWTEQKSINHTLVVYFAPLTDPVITQSPKGPINDGETVVLTCDVIGGNPLANLSWQCPDLAVIPPTGSQLTKKATSRIQLTVNSLYNGRICICKAVQKLWIESKTVNHTLVVHYSPSTNLSFKPSGIFYEDKSATFKCSMDGGNPLANLSISCSNITLLSNWTNNQERAVAYVSFDAKRYMNNMECICKANHDLFSKEITSKNVIVVYYPPSVTVDTSYSHGNETGSITLTCRANGVPDNYTYYGWKQLYNNVIIRNSENLAALSTADNKTLTLHNLTFEDMGQYACSASNLAPTTDGQHNSGISSLPVFFKPNLLKVNSLDNIYPARLHDNISIEVVYLTMPNITNVSWFNYSMPNITNVSWFNYSSFEEISASTTFEISLKKCKYNVSFHGKLVETDNYVYESTLHIINFSPLESGMYLLQVKNQYDTANFLFRAVVSSPPDKPLNVTGYSLTDSKVQVQWMSGFNGGHTQTFYIVYEVFGSKDMNSVKQAEIPYTQVYTKTIENLKPSTVYLFFMYSINSINSSASTDPFNLTTKSMIDTEQLTDDKDIIGIAAGSASVILLLAVIAVTIFLKRHLEYSNAKTKEDTGRLQLTAEIDANKDEGELKDNDLYVSAGPNYGIEQQSSTYAAVQKQNKSNVAETSLYSDIKKKSKEKKNAKEVYMVNKGNRNDGEENAEVYENVNVTKEYKDSTMIKNKDGLVYADLIFNPRPNGATYVIRGIENKTIYAEVDTTLKIDALPESDNEESLQNENNVNTTEDE